MDQRWQALDDVCRHQNWTLNALALAMSAGPAQEAVAILQQHGQVNGRNDEGVTPSMAAVVGYNDAQALALIDALYASGADFERSSDQVQTVLNLALARNTLDVVRTLLDHGVDPNQQRAQEQHGRCEPALHTAMIYGPPGAVALLLNHGADANMLDGRAQSALTVAVLQGRVEDVEVLLAAGANVNRCDLNGDGPLHHAVRLGPSAEGLKLPQTPALNVGAERITQALLAAGANPEAVNGEGDTPLHAALRVEIPATPSVRRYPRPQDERRFARAQQTRQKFVEQRRHHVYALLDGGADPNHVNAQGATALMQAIDLRSIDETVLDEPLIARLLTHGADWQRPTLNGKLTLRDVFEDQVWRGGLTQASFEAFERCVETFALRQTVEQTLPSALAPRSSRPRL